MTDLTYDNIEYRMCKAIEAQEEAQKQHARDLRDLAIARAKFKTVSASSFVNHRIAGSHLGVKMTDKLADALSAVDTDEFRQEYEMAEANENASRQALLSLRSELDSLRSLMASYRDPR